LARGSNNQGPIVGFIIILMSCLVALFFVFGGLASRYRSNIAFESASHLVEINHQVKSYIEHTVLDDSDLTQSLMLNLSTGDITDETQLLDYLGAQRDIWDVESIRIYTEDGLCYDQGGIAQNRDAASEFAYRVQRDGEASAITDSMLEYGVPVDTDVTVDGHRVVALSVVRDLDALIDGMGLQSFEGQGYLYLTRQNGVKVSQSSTGATPVVFNVTSLFDDGTLECLSQGGLSLKDAMGAGEEAVFLYDSDGMSRYVVMTPVEAMGETWYLFYLVPEATVNQTMDGFVQYILTLTIVVMSAFTALIIIFFLVYRARSRRYAKDMRERERLFDLLVSDTDTAFILLSEKSDVPLYLSSNAGRILGTDSPRISHEGGLRIVDGTGPGTITLAHINEALAAWDGQTEFTTGYIPYGRPSSPRYTVLHLYPAREKAGEYVGIAQDVTEERQREEELRSALALADSANHAKTRFLSNMSHDIRTPMNAIVNMTRFALRDEGDRAKVHGYLEIIQGSSEHLLQLINDVLDMSRIESGELVFSSEPFDIREVLETVCEMIAQLCAAKDQMLVRHIDRLEHPRILGDPLKLQQILINLLNNAVKFTPEYGHISFTVSELHALRDGTVNLRFEVADDGIGMDDATIERAFDPFARGGDSEVRAVEGSGLGLSITKSIIDAMGGRISVRSTPGEGSDFVVELFFPIDDATDDAAPAPSEPAVETRFDGRRALLAEDNPVNQTIARIILEDWGFAVDVASDGEQALAAFVAADSRYDIVYMDIQMPVMDGYQTAEAIRASDAADAGSVPIVAMTANVFAEDVERARRAGMDGHVGKPIDPDELQRVTARLLCGDRGHAV